MAHKQCNLLASGYFELALDSFAKKRKCVHSPLKTTSEVEKEGTNHCRHVLCIMSAINVRYRNFFSETHWIRENLILPNIIILFFWARRIDIVTKVLTLNHKILHVIHFSLDGFFYIWRRNIWWFKVKETLSVLRKSGIRTHDSQITQTLSLLVLFYWFCHLLKFWGFYYK